MSVKLIEEDSDHRPHRQRCATCGSVRSCLTRTVEEINNRQNGRRHIVVHYDSTLYCASPEVNVVTPEGTILRPPIGQTVDKTDSCFAHIPARKKQL